jgi:hypothetical protein
LHVLRAFQQLDEFRGERTPALNPQAGNQSRR